MRKKYKRMLAFIGILIVSCVFVGVAYLFYEKVTSNETEVLVVGELSINYINGSLIKNNNQYKFSITNNGSNDVYYEILIDNLKNYESKVKYTLNSPEASISIPDNNLDTNTNILINNVLIPTGATQNFTLELKNNSMTSFNLKVKKTEDLEEYFYATILKNTPSTKNPKTKVGIDIATTNEGLIEDYDDMGLTYYYRGQVLNNYVSLADSLWRIVRINGDGTVKLVLDTDISELANYHNDVKESEDFAHTNILNILNTYYETYLAKYEDYIVSYKYCVEKESTLNETKKVYNAYNRLVTNEIPTFNCLGDSYNNRIGLLTADEVLYAGANFKDDNQSFYLYNADIENVWWTSTLAEATGTDFKPFAVSSSGKMTYDTSGTLFRSLRPTINLNRKVIVTGDGSKSNPYLIKEN